MPIFIFCTISILTRRKGDKTKSPPAKDTQGRLKRGMGHGPTNNRSRELTLGLGLGLIRPDKYIKHMQSSINKTCFRPLPCSNDKLRTEQKNMLFVSQVSGYGWGTSKCELNLGRSAFYACVGPRIFLTQPCSPQTLCPVDACPRAVPVGPWTLSP